MRDYTKIQAWQKADDLTVAIYAASRNFPKDELYGLTSQLRRAAYSVPANIVEGAARGSKKDYLHFLYIARGSLNEVSYFLHLAHRLGYLSPESAAPLQAKCDEAMRTLAGLVRAVETEIGPVARTFAKLTSLLALSIPLTSVSCL